MTKLLNPGQLTRLQILWGQHAQREMVTKADDRAARLEWASINAGRKIESFKDLTMREARTLIDILQGSLGIANARPDRSRARGMGTDGRRGKKTNTATLASGDDVERIQHQMSRLGWDQARLYGFLRSTSSPLRGRADVRTQAEANKVYWALKRMADQQQKKNMGQGVNG